MVDKKKICTHVSLEIIHRNNSHSRLVGCLAFLFLYLFELLSFVSPTDMSQAEQVPEDMPAYLKDEPVGTGKLQPLYSQASSVLQLCAVQVGDMINENYTVDCL